MKVPMGKGSVKKLYYSIGEVSRITDLEPHVLRYWESEFPKLRPQKNKAGNRTYRIKDIQLIFQIKKLLYEDRFTIEGAKQRLTSGVEGEPNQLKLTFTGDKPKVLVSKVKKELQDILKLLES
jgi:DNA-binding transcriptional MerR regulator